MAYQWFLSDLESLTHSLNSNSFEVGGVKCRLILYPRGDSLSLEGYLSVYLQVLSPCNSLLRFQVAMSKEFDRSVTVSRDSLVLISSEPCGWSNFALADRFASGAVITVDVSIETFNVKDSQVSWKMSNFSLISQIINSKRTISSAFSVGGRQFDLRIGSHVISGQKYLSAWLESASDAQFWCLFHFSLSKIAGKKSLMTLRSRYSNGRFQPGSPSLGWADFKEMDDLSKLGEVEFIATVHVVNNASVFAADHEKHSTLSWKIDHFQVLTNFLKKKKIEGLYIESSPIYMGSKKWRLRVYPRGIWMPDQNAGSKSLAVYLELVDLQNVAHDWSCRVEHVLVLTNKNMEKNCVKNFDQRYSKSAFDFGCQDFMLVQHLNDKDAGFLCDGEIEIASYFTVLEVNSMLISSDSRIAVVRPNVIWKVDTFTSEQFTKKSWVSALWGETLFIDGVCQLQLGIREDFGFLRLFLMPDKTDGRCYWIKYKLLLMNEKNARIAHCESSLLTKEWEISSLQVIKYTNMENNVHFVCSIEDCCPWFYLSDLKVPINPVDDDFDLKQFKKIVHSAGFTITSGEKDSLEQVIWADENSKPTFSKISTFLCDLRSYLNHPSKVLRLLRPNSLQMIPVMNLLMAADFMKHGIIDLLLDLMATWMKPSEGSIMDFKPEELLQVIFDVLMPVDNLNAWMPLPSLDKMICVIENARGCLLQYSFQIIPRLIDIHNHFEVVFKLMDFLKTCNLEHASQCLFAALDALDGFSIEDHQWIEVTSNAFELLAGCDDDMLIFRFISNHCKSFDIILENIELRFKSSPEIWGTGISYGLLNFLSTIVHNDIGFLFFAKALLKQTDFGSLLDVYILMEIISIEDMLNDVCEAFRQALKKGKVNAKLIAAVLEAKQNIRRFQIRKMAKESDIKVIVKFCETLAGSIDEKMRGFSRVMYSILFNIYVEENEQEMILKSLLDTLLPLDMNILFAVAEECKATRSVFNMLQKLAGIAKVGRDKLARTECDLKCSLDGYEQLMGKLSGLHATSTIFLNVGQQFEELEKVVEQRLTKMLGRITCLETQLISVRRAPSINPLEDVKKLQDLTLPKDHVAEVDENVEDQTVTKLEDPTLPKDHVAEVDENVEDQTAFEELKEKLLKALSIGALVRNRQSNAQY